MARTDQTGPELVESDLLFHVAVAEASNNPFMRSISALIEVALATTFQFSSPIPEAKNIGELLTGIAL